MMVATVIAAAAMAGAVTTVGNAKHTLDAADSATDASSERASDNTANRTGNPIAFTGAFPRAADHALPVRQMGNGEQRQNAGQQRQFALGGRAGR